MSLRDKTAVVGVGSTPYYKRGQSLPQTPFELAVKAVLAAVEDAGLTIDDVDGLALYSMGLGGDTSPIVEGVGLRNTRERLYAMYAGRHRLELLPGREGLRVRVSLPYREANRAG